jgi:hypothetical protein
VTKYDERHNNIAGPLRAEVAINLADDTAAYFEQYMRFLGAKAVSVYEFVSVPNTAKANDVVIIISDMALRWILDKIDKDWKGIPIRENKTNARPGQGTQHMEDK